MAENKRITFLRNQFSKIDNETFDKILSYDPTPENKYSTWLLRLYSKSALSLNDLPTLKESINLHLSLKDSIPVEFRDINKFESAISFLHSINVWFTNRFIENEKSMNYLRSGAELIFKNENIEIVKLLAFEGSLAFGSGTKWCTLQRSTFYDYTDKGPLYIVTPLNKSYEKIFGKKSQLHFTKLEFRNNNNEEIDLIESMISFPELYEPLKSTQLLKNTTHELGHFFNMNESPESLVKCIEIKGYRVLQLIKNLNREFIDELFLKFGEESYEYIPDSKEKIVSFICNVEKGLKIILKKNEIQIEENDFKESVRFFPENILLMDCDDEQLWEDVIKNETWLVKKSPFFKDSEKLFSLVLKDIDVLHYFVPTKVFTAEQLEKIALHMMGFQFSPSILKHLKKLGKLSNEVQLKLIKHYPHSIQFLVSPSDESKKLSEKIIKKEEKKKEEEEVQSIKKMNKLKTVMDIYGDYIKYNDCFDSGDDYMWDVKKFYNSDEGSRFLKEIINENGEIHRYWYDNNNNKYYEV